MSFDISCHLTFHVILVILVIIEIIVTKAIMTLLLKVIIKERCVFKKWVRLIVIGQYHVKVFLKDSQDKVIVVFIMIDINRQVNEAVSEGNVSCLASSALHWFL